MVPPACAEQRSWGCLDQGPEPSICGAGLDRDHRARAVPAVLLQRRVTVHRAVIRPTTRLRRRTSLPRSRADIAPPLTPGCRGLWEREDHAGIVGLNSASILSQLGYMDNL